MNKRQNKFSETEVKTDKPALKEVIQSSGKLPWSKRLMDQNKNTEHRKQFDAEQYCGGWANHRS